MEEENIQQIWKIGQQIQQNAPEPDHIDSMCGTQIIATLEVPFLQPQYTSENDRSIHWLISSSQCIFKKAWKDMIQGITSE